MHSSNISHSSQKHKNSFQAPEKRTFVKHRGTERLLLDTTCDILDSHNSELLTENEWTLRTNRTPAFLASLYLLR